MKFKMELKGLNKLEKKLSNIENKVAKKIVRSASRKAQNIAAKEVKLNAISMVGGEMGNLIASAMKVQAIHKQKKGSYALAVAIDKKKAEQFLHTTKAGKRYFIPTLVEFGYKKVGGGKVPANPFMRKAAEKTAKKRVNKVFSEINKGIDKA